MLLEAIYYNQRFDNVSGELYKEIKLRNPFIGIAYQKT